MSNSDIALIFTPLLGSFLSTFLFGNVKNKQYQKAWFQPPGYVFMIVWTAIYIQLGFLLYQSKKDNDNLVLSLVIAIILVSYSWVYIFNYLKFYKVAIFVIFLLLILAFELLIALIKNNYSDSYLYTYPLFLAWLIFALILAADSRKKVKN